MNIVNRETTLVPVDALKPHPKNPNQGNIGLIGQSISHNGFYGSLVVQQSTGHILRGNHSYVAARQAGAQEVPVTYVDVDDETALRILLVDNKSTREGIDDSNALALLLQELAATPAGLAGSGYDGDALDELLADLGQMQTELRGDPDAVPEVPADQEPTTRRGDIIRLGRHTLGCLDSTDADEVARLLDGAMPDMAWTDPPYGVGVLDKDGHNGQGERFGTMLGRRTAFVPFAGDDSTAAAIAGYRVCANLAVPVLIFWGGNYYAHALPPSACWIVWDKETGGNDFPDAELAWTNQSTPARVFRHQWNGMMRASERGEKRIAPTQKPVALAEWCFAQYGHEGDVVLDLFGGSGTCLIAAERTGRTCYMAELSEHYCDCIIARWEATTGQRAERPAGDHERVTAGAGRLPHLRAAGSAAQYGESTASDRT